MEKTQFITTFSSVVKPLVSEEYDKYLALASLVNIGEFVPDVDNKNIDLLPIAFNAAVANRVNKNGDVIDVNTALAIYEDFINKPINIEHDRSRVIGVILTAGFSEFGTDRPLTKEEVQGSSKPFNITLGGVLWKIVNNNLTQMIERSSDPSSLDYNKISASWELGFSEYNVVILDENEKNIENGEIVAEEEKISELKEYLKGFGGEERLEDGRYAYRQVIGDVLPLGIGLTENPAADVKGIITKSSEENIESELLNKENEKNEEFCSQNTSENVIKSEETKVMEIKSVADITDENLKQIEASAISDFIEQELQKASEQYLEDKNKLDDALKTAKEENEKLSQEHETIKKDLESVQSSLDTLEEEKKDRERQEKFNERMASFDEKYELSDSEKEIVAKDIAILDEEAFSAYTEKMSVLLKDKERTSEEPNEVEAKTEEAVASEVKEEAKEEAQEEKLEENASEVEEIVEDAIDKADEQDAETIPATTSAEAQTLYEKYKDAFNESNFEIKI